MTQLNLDCYIHNTGGRFKCMLCGELHHQAHAACRLVDAGGGKVTQNYGDVCPECLKAGAAGAAQRAREHSAELRQRAAALDELASEVEQISPWLSPADLQAAEREAHRQFLAAA